jgi:hypothetical protein
MSKSWRYCIKCEKEIGNPALDKMYCDDCYREMFPIGMKHRHEIILTTHDLQLLKSGLRCLNTVINDESKNKEIKAMYDYMENILNEAVRER